MRSDVPSPLLKLLAVEYLAPWLCPRYSALTITTWTRGRTSPSRTSYTVRTSGSRWRLSSRMAARRSSSSWRLAACGASSRTRSWRLSPPRWSPTTRARSSSRRTRRRTSRRCRCTTGPSCRTCRSRRWTWAGRTARATAGWRAPPSTRSRRWMVRRTSRRWSGRWSRRRKRCVGPPPLDDSGYMLHLARFESKSKV